MGLGRTLGVYLKAISSSGSLLLLLLLHFHGGEIITGASAVSPTATAAGATLGTGTEQKCDKAVEVETVELLSYLGNVTFTAPTPFRGRWTTVIKFTSPFTFIGGWGVTVQTFGRKAYAIFDRNVDENLKVGDKIVFQFRVLYGYNVKVPKVLSIKWNNKTICGAPIAGGAIIPESTLRKTFDNLQLDSSSEEAGDSLSDDDSDPDSQSTDGQTASEEVDVDDNVRETIQQHIASNRIRLISNWKPAAKKD